MKLLALIVYTLRELAAKATLIILAAISTIIIIGTLAAVSIREIPDGNAIFILGQQASPALPQDQIATLIGQMQAGLAGGLFSGILLFGIIATAGVIPDALEKGTVDVYLSKPIARWQLLLGKSLGSVSAILVNVVYFIGVAWLVLALKMGVWGGTFLLSIPLLTLMFTCTYAIVILFGVVARNAIVPILATYLYLLIGEPLLQNREATLYLLSSNSIYRGALDGLYYILPQISSMKEQASRLLTQQPADWKPFLTSFLSATALFLCGALILRKKDF